MRRFGCILVWIMGSFACFGANFYRQNVVSSAIGSVRKRPDRPWNLGLAFGGGLRSTAKVLGYVNGSYLNSSNEITVRPGGGLGFFLTGGKSIHRNFSFQGEIGYQFSRVRPTFLNYSIRFIRLQTSLMAVFSPSIGNNFKLEFGLGPGFWLANRLVFLPSSSLTSPEPLVKFHFTNEAGLTSQIGISHGDARSRFFLILQQNWVTFDLRKVEVDGKTVRRTREMKSTWNNLNGNGLWLKAGVCWFL
jgi:hypothetical protein